MKTERGQRREAIALAEGIRPESVRMREYRQARAQNRTPKSINPVGMELDSNWAKGVDELRELVSSASRSAHRAATLLDKASADPSLVPGIFITLRQEMRLLAGRIRQAIPESLCPSCKGLDECRPHCAGCETLGWIRKGQCQDIPKALWDESEPKVIHNGKTVLVSEVCPVEPKAEPEEVLWP